MDSTTDRISEGFMLTAIAWVLARNHHPAFVAVAVAAVVGSFLVSYTRARAEALGLRGGVGIGSPAERVVGITAGPPPAPAGGAAPGVPPLPRSALVYARPCRPCLRA